MLLPSYHDFGFVYSISVDCEWSVYGNWNECSKTCGSGTQIRTREIKTQEENGGKQCAGDKTELQLCNEFPCPSK